MKNKKMKNDGCLKAVSYISSHFNLARVATRYSKVITTVCALLLMQSAAQSATLPLSSCNGCDDMTFGDLIPECAGDGVATCTPSCSYTIGGFTTTNSGSPDEVIGQNLRCENCVCCDNDDASDDPPALSCAPEELTVSYTETVSASVGGSIEASLGNAVVGSVKASVESEIGHSSERTKTFTLSSCGPASGEVASCKVGEWAATLAITDDIEIEADVTINWAFSCSGGECGNLAQKKTTACDTGTATGTGSSYSTTKTCKSVVWEDCPSD